MYSLLIPCSNLGHNIQFMLKKPFIFSLTLPPTSCMYRQSKTTTKKHSVDFLQELEGFVLITGDEEVSPRSALKRSHRTIPEETMRTKENELKTLTYSEKPGYCRSQRTAWAPCEDAVGCSVARRRRPSLRGPHTGTPDCEQRHGRCGGRMRGAWGRG
jgi:hypothetical protein